MPGVSIKIICLFAIVLIPRILFLVVCDFLEVIDKRNYDRTYDLIEDRAYSALFSRKYDDVLENTLRTMRAEAFVEFKELN